VRHPNHALSLLFPNNQHPNLFGLAATGIPFQATIAGMKAIGAGHPMKVHVGSARVTMESASITAIGKVITAASNMTINGITIMSAITAAITITTITITVTAMITMTTTKIARINLALR
jgi:copper(I)-binding protein